MGLFHGLRTLGFECRERLHPEYERVQYVRHKAPANKTGVIHLNCPN